MSRKLDRLTTIAQHLDHMDRGLTQMNGTLAAANGKLDRMRELETGMTRLDGDLRTMRRDIHTMAHKIDGSFLFRGVK
jgi:hypothetical protein